MSSAQNVQAAQVASLGPGASSLTASTIAASQKSAKGDSGGGSGFSFDDFLDIINPLQHLPVIGTIYRAITGDKIGDFEQVAGDGLYGGLVGLGSSIANVIFKDITGKDFGDTVLSWAEDAVGIGGSPTAVADAKPSTPTAQTPTAQTPTAQAPAAQQAVARADPSQAPATPASLFNAPLAPPPAPIASAAPRPLAAKAAEPATQAPQPVVPAQATAMLADPNAFMATLAARGVDPALGMRAMMAYQKSLGLGDKQDKQAQP